MYIMSSSDLTPLGQEIDNHLKRLGWSQRKLAEEADIDSASVSRLMRGVQDATHPLIEKIADALRVDVLHLKEVAGLRVITPPAQRDSRVEYIAQRIDALPDAIKEQAIDAVGAQVDAIYNIAGVEARTAEEEIGDAANNTVPESAEYRNELKAKRQKNR